MLWNGLSSSSTAFAAHITPICLLAKSIPQQHSVQKHSKSFVFFIIASEASYVDFQTRIHI